MELVAKHFSFSVYINDFIHADWATVCRAECLGFPVAPTTCQLICNTHLDVGQPFPWKYLRQPLANILYFFRFLFSGLLFFFGEGIKPALRRAAVKKI